MAKEVQSKEFEKMCLCEEIFHSKSKYYRHLKKCRLALEKGKGRFSEGTASRKWHFTCKDCSFTCQYNKDFRVHIESAHLISMKTEEINFDNYNEFREWKDDYERGTNSSFLHSKTAKRKHGRSEYFICNRSGKYESQAAGKRGIRPKGSAKIGQNCTATITVFIDNSDKVCSKVCHTHYGHQTELSYLSIPKKVRHSIAEQLKKGIDPNEILYNITKVSRGKLERHHLITRRDLLNISKAFKIPFPSSAIKRRKKKNNKLDLFGHDYCESFKTEKDSIDIAEEIIYDDTEEIKSTLLLDLNQLCERIKQCNNKESLLRVKENIEVVTNSLDSSGNWIFSTLENRQLDNNGV